MLKNLQKETMTAFWYKINIKSMFLAIGLVSLLGWQQVCGMDYVMPPADDEDAWPPAQELNVAQRIAEESDDEYPEDFEEYKPMPEEAADEYIKSILDNIRWFQKEEAAGRNSDKYIKRYNFLLDPREQAIQKFLILNPDPEAESFLTELARQTWIRKQCSKGECCVNDCFWYNTGCADKDHYDAKGISQLDKESKKQGNPHAFCGHHRMRFSGLYDVTEADLSAAIAKNEESEEDEDEEEE